MLIKYDQSDLTLSIQTLINQQLSGGLQQSVTQTHTTPVLYSSAIMWPKKVNVNYSISSNKISSILKSVSNVSENVPEDDSDG